MKLYYTIVRFIIDDKILEIATYEIQVNTQFYMLYNQPVNWIDYNIWKINNVFNIHWKGIGIICKKI